MRREQQERALERGKQTIMQAVFTLHNGNISVKGSSAACNAQATKACERSQRYKRSDMTLRAT
jgi:hypothetical protein